MNILDVINIITWVTPRLGVTWKLRQVHNPSFIPPCRVQLYTAMYNDVQWCGVLPSDMEQNKMYKIQNTVHNPSISMLSTVQQKHISNVVLCNVVIFSTVCFVGNTLVIAALKCNELKWGPIKCKETAVQFNTRQNAACTLHTRVCHFYTFLS